MADVIGVYCLVWVYSIHTNLPKPYVVALCPPYLKKAYEIGPRSNFWSVLKCTVWILN